MKPGKKPCQGPNQLPVPPSQTTEPWPKARLQNAEESECAYGYRLPNAPSLLPEPTEGFHFFSRFKPPSRCYTPYQRKRVGAWILCL